MKSMIKTSNDLKTVKVEKDTWILEVPKEVCEREGFAAGTLVSLTLSNNSISAKYLKPSKEIDDFVDSIIENEKEFFEEMKRLGD